MPLNDAAATSTPALAVIATILRIFKGHFQSARKPIECRKSDQYGGSSCLFVPHQMAQVEALEFHQLHDGHHGSERVQLVAVPVGNYALRKVAHYRLAHLWIDDVGFVLASLDEAVSEGVEY
jgi:hypothetical protein